MKMYRTRLFPIMLLFLTLIVSCDDKTDNTNNTQTIIGSWTKTGGHIITFYNSGAVTTNNLGTGTYGSGNINLAVALGNSGTGSYNLNGNKLIISGFKVVGATRFDNLNGEWLKME